MKRLIHLLLLMLSLHLSACTSRQQQADHGGRVSQDDEIEQVEAGEKDYRAELKRILGSDEWASDPYFNNIERTKSVYRNRECPTALFGFMFGTNELNKRNPHLTGWIIHEGGYDAEMRFDDVKGLLVSDADAFGNAFEIHVIDDNTVDFVYPKLKRTDRYRKVGDYQNELRHILMEGSYRFDGNSLKLGRKGEVSGFMNYRSYEIACDFTEGIEQDAVIFFNDPKGGNWSEGDIFYYSITSKDMILRKVTKEWQESGHQLTDTTYLLIKQ